MSRVRKNADVLANKNTSPSISMWSCFPVQASLEESSPTFVSYLNEYVRRATSAQRQKNIYNKQQNYQDTRSPLVHW